MAEPQARISRIRRLAAIVGGVCLVAGAGAPAAVAGLAPPAPTGSGLSVTPVADLTEVLDAPEEITESVMLTPDTASLAETVATGPERSEPKLSEPTDSGLPTPAIAVLPGASEENAETATLTSDIASLEKLGEAAGPALEAQLPEAVAPPSQAVDNVQQTLDQPLPVALANTLAQTAAPVLTQVTGTLAETTAPVLEPVQQTPLLSETVETLSAVTESAGVPLPLTQPLLPETLPVLDAVLDSTAPALGGADVTITTDGVRQLLETTQPVVTAATPLVATDIPASESSPPAEIGPAGAVEPSPIVPPTPSLSAASQAPISSSREKLASPPNGASEVRSPDVGSTDFPALLVPGGYETTIPNSGGATASPPSTPPPFAPGGPLPGLASAAATAGAGALVLLLAALAAALLLAAPGLGRTIRPTLAPWPQPILASSLERPG